MYISEYFLYGWKYVDWEMIFVWQGLRIEMEKIGIYCPIMQYIYYIICRYLLYENTGEDIIKKK